MTRTTECSRALNLLPACAAVVAFLAVPALAGQVRYRVDRQENFRLEPGPAGTMLGTVQAGVVVTGGQPRDGWVQVTLDGWIWSRSVTPRARDGFDVAVAPSGGENLRVDPNGAVRARLREGTLLDEVERRDGWVRVRRSAWMWERSLSRLDPAPAVATRDSAPASVPTLDRATLATDAPVARTAAGDTVGNLESGTPVRVLGRVGGWARVQVDVWVPESALRPGAEGVLTGVSGAELRARPEEFVGRVVQWRVQVVSQQVADELRPDMPSGAPYLLVRGPMPEAGFAYVLVPEGWRERTAALGALAEILMLARVRVGRTRYLGNPVLELLEFQSVGR